MNYFKFYAVFFLIVCGVASQAQENLVKVGFTGALLGDLNLGFERKITDKSSLNFKVGFLEPTLSPLLREEIITPNAYNLVEANGGISSSAEFRFYFSKKPGIQGLYLAPFLRYFNQSMLYNDEIDNNRFSVDTKLSSSGFGVQMGYQWIIKESFTVDFFFFGTGVDFHKAEIKYVVDSPPPGFDYSMVTPHVEDVFKDIRLLNKNMSHEARDDGHFTNLPVRLPSIRAGISIGWAF